MKYFVDLDENGYVVAFGISNTEEDNVEINVENIDIKHINAYKIVDGELVLDEEKLKELKAEEEQKAKAEEIAKLKQELANTDYEAIKYSEGWFTEEEYSPIKAKRESLREQIRKLENE